MWRKDSANWETCHRRTSGACISSSSVEGLRASLSRLSAGHISDWSSDNSFACADRQTLSCLRLAICSWDGLGGEGFRKARRSTGSDAMPLATALAIALPYRRTPNCPIPEMLLRSAFGSWAIAARAWSGMTRKVGRPSLSAADSRNKASSRSIAKPLPSRPEPPLMEMKAFSGSSGGE